MSSGSGPARKISVRDSFREYAERELKRKLGDLKPKQLTFALAKFFIDEIHNPLKLAVSGEDFDRGYVDAGGDLGIDFIHGDDHSVLIVQSKYCSQGKGPSPDEISHFLTVLRRLRDPSKLKANAALADAAADIDWSEDQFICRFVCLGRIENQVKTLSESAPHLPDDRGLADRVTFEFLGESELTEELRAARSQSRVGNQASEIFAHEEGGRRGPIIQLDGDGNRSCVMVVRASQVVELYKRFREGLFELNIRNYVGETKTNRAMIQTARDQGARFFHMNNGISCVATSLEIDPKKGSVSVTGLQVINGAQTVKSLRKAAAAPWANDEPMLLVRIVEIPQGYGEAGRFRTDVVRANNTQNKVKDSDFRSNDPIQTDLGRQFSRFKRHGRSVVYVPKRTDSVSGRNAELIRLEEFAKTIYSFLVDPVSFSGSTSFLFDDSDSGGYRHIFGDGHAVWDVMPGDEFRLRSALWWVGQEFAQRFSSNRTNEQNPLRKAARERKWLLYYAAAAVLRGVYGDSFKGALSKRYEGDWVLGEERTGKWFADAFKRSENALLMAYELAAEKERFVHRNWMRDKTTPAEILKAAQRVNDYSDQLEPL